MSRQLRLSAREAVVFRQDRNALRSITEEPPEARAQLLFRQLALTHPPVPHGVDERQELVERGVFPRGRRRGLVQKLERDAAHRMARKLLAG